MYRSIALFNNLISWVYELRRDIGKKESLVYILAIAILATGVSGLLLFLLDSNIHSLMDGIWSAWVTMTHVGFGDVVPTSFLGRVLAAAVILLGFVLFSLFTATLSVAFLGKNMAAMGRELRSVERDSGRVIEEEDRILQELARLHERLDRMEQALAAADDYTRRH